MEKGLVLAFVLGGVTTVMGNIIVKQGKKIKELKKTIEEA